jgi:hypothetical protein
LPGEEYLAKIMRASMPIQLIFSIADESDAAIAALRNSAAEAQTQKYGQGNWSSAPAEKSLLRTMARRHSSRL